MAEADELILTPTARLARALAAEHAARARADGQAAWRRPQILSFRAWQARLRDDYFLDAEDPRTPVRADQARELWRAVIDRTVFIGEPRVAELAERAWSLVHEHGLEPPERWPELLLSPDTARFRDWARDFRALCARRKLVDENAFGAELPDLLAAGRIALPGRIVLQGFDLPPTALQARLLDAAEAAGTRVDGRPDNAPAAAETALEVSGGLLEAPDPEAELLAAARWARARLERDPAARLAVVVPDLEGRIDQADRAFRKVFDPAGFRLAAGAGEPWHLSLGKPLAHWPLVADGLLILGLDPHRLDQPRLTRLLRSPFLAGWNTEHPDRARAVVALARRHPRMLTAFEFTRRLGKEGLDEVGRRFAAWNAARREPPAKARQSARQSAGQSARPSAWVRQFQSELTAFGHGAGRPLDSREFQLLGRWQELLEAFAALDAVVDGPLTRGQALARLTEGARAVFRERNPGAPVEILGVREALGSPFDGLWIAGMDAESWPPPARREPLVPGPIQASVPGATAESALARARLELKALLASAPDVVASYTPGDGDTPRGPTPLLSGPERAFDSGPGMEAAILAPAEDDARAPEAAPGRYKGGTGLLRRQSECPFRAFAQARLGAEEFSPPRPGLGPDVRGGLVHAALERFWTDCPDSASLQALDDDALEAAIGKAVNTALDELLAEHRLLLTREGRRLEAERLAALLADWLARERTRPPFRVAAREATVSIELAGLTVGGKIDRVDELDGGGTLLIDYKTGSPLSASHWKPEARLRDPQMPAYALALDAAPAGIAFAHVRPDLQCFRGVAETELDIPGVQPVVSGKGKPRYQDVEGWAELLDGWRFHLERLAEGFLAGRAEVDPVRGDTCRYCHLHALCRIHERAAWVNGDEAEEDENGN